MGANKPRVTGVNPVSERNKHMCKIIKNGSGLYYKTGCGFTANIDEASRLDEMGVEDILNSCEDLGISNLTVEDEPVFAPSGSWAVCYIREGDLNGDGSIKLNTNNPSRRRFATRCEAIIHGSRFHVRKAKGSGVAGSAGHVGFWVIQTNDPVNAAINPETGLTNPV
jgi:hypothetical protein